MKLVEKHPVSLRPTGRFSTTNKHKIHKTLQKIKEEEIISFHIVIK